MKVLRRMFAIRPLVLFALVAQLLAAAGHIHFGHPGAQTGAQIAGVTQKPAWPPGSSRHGPDPHDSHDCAICWAAVAAGTAVLGGQTEVPVPAQLDGAPILPPAIEAASKRLFSAFQARGPPSMIRA